MTILDRYLGARFGWTLLKTLVALVGLFVAIDLLGDKRGDIMKQDVPWTVVVQYYLVFIPRIAYLMAPLSVLIAALLVLGEAAQSNEVTAALASGVSLRRLVRWPVLVALAFAVATFGAEQTVGAAATRAANQIERDFFTRNYDYRRAPVSWANLSGDWTCHIAKFNRLALTGQEVGIHAFRDDEIVRIVADRIYWHEDREEWLLENGRWMVFPEDFGMKLEDARITQGVAPFTESPDELFAANQPADQKTTRQLRVEIAKAVSRGEPVGRMLVDYYAKYSHPALTFIMILLAIPFALRIRRGGLAISFGASVVIAITYLIVYAVVTQLGYAERLGPVTAAWLANGVFFVLGLVLFWRTPT
jgi:lipopolysaccharide export system permease protein